MRGPARYSIFYISLYALAAFLLYIRGWRWRASHSAGLLSPAGPSQIACPLASPKLHPHLRAEGIRQASLSVARAARGRRNATRQEDDI